MSDFMKWLYPHYIKPYLQSAPKGDYQFWLDLMENGLDPNCQEEFEKTLEFTAVQGFLLGLRTGMGLAPYLPEASSAVPEASSNPRSKVN